MLLALKTLGSFAFSDASLIELIRQCSYFYLDSDDLEIRQAAAQTCCKLLSQDPILFQTSNHAMQVVSEILDRILILGVTDTGKADYSPLLLANLQNRS